MLYTHVNPTKTNIQHAQMLNIITDNNITAIKTLILFENIF
jgi:hypothetical protein